MHTSMCIMMDIVGIILLVLLYVNFGANTMRYRQTDGRLYTALLVVNMALLISDLFTWPLNGAQFSGARFLNLLCNTLYYMLHPVMGFTWLLYCQTKLHMDDHSIHKWLPLTCIPVLCTAVLSIVNCFIPLLFSVNTQNIYHRGPLYPVFMALSFVYFFISVILIWVLTKKRRQTLSTERVFLLLYPLLPAIAAVLQSLIYGLAIIWTASALSLLMIYFNLQNTQVTTDPLTGINNRRRFETYLENKLYGHRKQPLLFMLMLDIDHFKQINDMHGHLMGDDAIKNMAHLVISSVERSDFVARIGGDEFVVVGERQLPQQIQETICSIRQATRMFNQKKIVPYRLAISIGSASISPTEMKTVDDLILEADIVMYTEKHRHRTACVPT